MKKKISPSFRKAVIAMTAVAALAGILFGIRAVVNSKKSVGVVSVMSIADTWYDNGSTGYGQISQGGTQQVWADRSMLISKVYVSRALAPHPKKGDILVFYRTGGLYKGVVTTIGMVTDTRECFSNKAEFIQYCLRGSVFPEKELEKMWDYKPQKPFVVNFLYVYSFPKRINMERLIDLGIFKGVNDAPRGFFKISKAQFESILKETASEGRFVVD